jgi:hypothetical protein
MTKRPSKEQFETGLGNMFPSVPKPETMRDWQRAKAGLRKVDPKSDKDRGYVSPLGGQVRWPGQRSK